MFGEIIAYVFTIEFQKRGLPDTHLVVTLNPNNKIMSPQMIDKYNSAEIPNDDKEMQKLAIKNMLHGPHTNQSPCLIKKQPICKKKFPKQFRDTILKKKMVIQNIKENIILVVIISIEPKAATLFPLIIEW